MLLSTTRAGRLGASLLHDHGVCRPAFVIITSLNILILWLSGLSDEPWSMYRRRWWWKMLVVPASACGSKLMIPSDSQVKSPVSEWRRQSWTWRPASIFHLHFGGTHACRASWDTRTHQSCPRPLTIFSITHTFDSLSPIHPHISSTHHASQTSTATTTNMADKFTRCLTKQISSREIGEKEKRFLVENHVCRLDG